MASLAAVGCGGEGSSEDAGAADARSALDARSAQAGDARPDGAEHAPDGAPPRPDAARPDAALVSGELWAEGVSGALEDGASLVIVALSGESFGEQGPPSAQVFDRFAGRSPGDPRDPTTPDIGAWSGYGYAYADHDDYVAEALSGESSFQGFTQGTRGASLRANGLQLTAPEKVREVFMSGNLFVPPGGWGGPSTYVDDEGWPTASYAKLFWIEDGPTGGSVSGAWDMLAYGIGNGRIGVPSSGNEPILNGRRAEEFPAWTREAALRDFFDHSRWHLLQYGFREPATTYGSTPAAFRRLTVQGGSTVQLDLDVSGTYEPFAEGVSTSFDSVSFPGYIRTQERDTPEELRRRLYLDDVYIALGPGAMCRVELHDAEDDALARVVAVSPVRAGDWSTTRIETTLRFNREVPARPAGYWLKVFGADGQRITARELRAAP